MPALQRAREPQLAVPSGTCRGHSESPHRGASVSAGDGVSLGLQQDLGLTAEEHSSHVVLRPPGGPGLRGPTLQGVGTTHSWLSRAQLWEWGCPCPNWVVAEHCSLGSELLVQKRPELHGDPLQARLNSAAPGAGGE